jgi:hypothetical protein
LVSGVILARGFSVLDNIREFVDRGAGVAAPRVVEKICGPDAAGNLNN